MKICRKSDGVISDVNPVFIADFVESEWLIPAAGESLFVSVDGTVIAATKQPAGYSLIDSLPTGESLESLIPDGMGGWRLKRADQLIKSALQHIADAHQSMLIAATGGASAAERDTWVVKEAAALDVLTGGDGSGAIVPVDGESLETLAEKIVAKAAGYRHIVGIADKIKRQAEKAVETLALETPDDLEQLDVVLATAKTLADAAIAQVMGE